MSGNKAGAFNAQKNNKQDREVLQSGSNLDLVESYNVAGILQRQGCRLQGLEGEGPPEGQKGGQVRSVRGYIGQASTRLNGPSQDSSRACLAKTVELAVLALG